MSYSALRPELVSLIHHVELNKAGWWDKTIQKLIVFAVWLDKGVATVERISEIFEKEFSIKKDQINLENHISELCSVGVLIQLTDNQYKLSESSLQDYERNIVDGQELESEVRRRFNKLFKQSCPTLDLDSTWEVFNTGLLVPLVQEIGARTYELISGSVTSVLDTVSFQDFLRGYEQSLHQSIRDAVILFLDPANTHVRAYVLRHLNAYFFVEAASLNKDALTALTEATKKKPVFKIFVDTNFLFSALGIHENPSNDSARALISLVSQLSDTLDAKIYVLPHTIEEARRTLSSHIEPLKGLKLTPNLAAAAINTNLTGIAKRYAQVVVDSKQPIKADEYFEPYISDLMAVAREKGIQVYNRNTDNLNIRSDVIDDILIEIDHEKKAHPGREKTYQELEHDMVLWHFAKDQRPTALESPIGAQYWVTTLDYRLLRFDGYKRRNEPQSVPVCLHPAPLIQMLQFWVPRSEQFEAAILGTLRLPFLFSDFDPESERITTTILRTLSRYDSSGELTTDTAQRVFVNKVLRQKIAKESKVDRQNELVRDALVEVDEERTQALKKAQKIASSLENKVDEISSIASNFESKYEEKQKETLELHDKLQKERSERDSLETRLSSLEEDLLKKQIQAEINVEIKGFWNRVILYIISTIIISASAGMIIQKLYGIQWWPLTRIIGYILLTTCIYPIYRYVGKSEHLMKRKGYKLFHTVTIKIFIILAYAGIGIWQAKALSLFDKCCNYMQQLFK